MSLPLQVALTVAPLACYFYVIGVWQSGRRPRVVAGPVDFAILVFGVVGLVTVGPVGEVLMGLIFTNPGPVAWGLWFLFLGLWTFILSGSASRRLVVYNLGPAQLQTAVAAALAELPASHFSPTLRGFESTVDHLSVHVEGSASLRVGTIDARGNDAEAFIRRLRPLLRDQLHSLSVGPSRVTWGLFVLSWLTMLAPLGIFLMTEPKARAAVRAIWSRMTGT